MAGPDFTLAELLVVVRFLRDTPLLSLARTIAKSRWLRRYDKQIDHRWPTVTR